jgi:hypothetical protein
MKRLHAFGGTFVLAGVACATTTATPAPAAAPAAAAPAVRDEGGGPEPLLLGKGKLLTDVSEDAHRPRVPDGLERRARRLHLKIYVSEAGNVTRVLLFRGEEPEVNAEAESKIKTWRYQPHLVGGKAVPFCFMMVLDMK